jgi:2-phospho-L-lactate guanylyltransferase
MTPSVRIFVMMKPPAEGKSRLAPSLSSERRALLSLAMLARVVTAARAATAGVSVVGGDETVRRLADALGARFAPEPAAGLNESLAGVLTSARAAGRQASLYLPADLPLVEATDVEGLLAASDGGRRLVITPDRQEQGTNALLVPSAFDFAPAFGAASFRRHVEQAQALGIAWQAYRSDRLALDVDTPADLEALLERRPAWWDEALAQLDGLGFREETQPALPPR